MNAQHQAIRAHKRVKRLLKQIRNTKDRANVWTLRKYERLDQLTTHHRSTEYLTVLG